MNPIEQFAEETRQRVAVQGADAAILQLRDKFTEATMRAGYSYNFTWMGRPIIQYPQDMIAMQEIIWRVQPDLIIETGVAHGGSLIYYASLLELIGKGSVLGIDIDIRAHNRSAIEAHPMSKRISLVQGSSVSDAVIDQVRTHAAGKETILVCLDSNHTHEHVLQELNLYHEFVNKGSYLVIFDTIVEDLPNDLFDNRPWSIGDNPKTAVYEFLKNNDRFEIDRAINDKILLSVSPDGYLKCIK